MATKPKTSAKGLPNGARKKAHVQTPAKKTGNPVIPTVQTPKKPKSDPSDWIIPGSVPKTTTKKKGGR